MLEVTYNEESMNHSISFTATSYPRLLTAMELSFTILMPPTIISTFSRRERIQRTNAPYPSCSQPQWCLCPCRWCCTYHSTSMLLKNRILSNVNNRKRFKQQVWRRCILCALRHAGDKQRNKNHENEGQRQHTGIGIQKRSKHITVDRFICTTERDDGLRSRSLWNMRWNITPHGIHTNWSIQTIHE